MSASPNGLASLANRISSVGNKIVRPQAGLAQELNDKAQNIKQYNDFYQDQNKLQAQDSQGGLKAPASVDLVRNAPQVQRPVQAPGGLQGMQPQAQVPVKRPAVIPPSLMQAVPR